MLIDFDDARRRDDHELRVLVRGGDPAERVWAAWAIAERAGADDLRALVGLTEGEPDPGVRRHLAVVLASHGEVDILVALARHDPHPAVRASAMRIVTRLAAAGVVPEAVVVEQLGDGAAEVREAILGELQVATPAVEAAVRRCFADHAPEVRREALTTGRRLAMDAVPDPPGSPTGPVDPTGPATVMGPRRTTALTHRRR